ncbi:MAG: ABC transporter substrate-binding protein [Candidatus Zixiibacteriota bacterium]
MVRQTHHKLDKKIILYISFLFSLTLCLVFSCEKRAEKEFIKVGVILPLSGELSTYGEECLNGIILRLDEVNHEGGIRGKKLSYVTEDNQGDPLKTANSVDLLARDEQVLAIIGAATSENTLAGASVAQHKKIPLLTPMATSPVVTEVGDYISRICFIDPYQGSALANFAFSFLKLKRTAVLTREEDQYSEGLTEYFIKNYRKMGGEIVSHLYYKEGERDFVSRLREIKEEKPEALFVPGYWNEAASIFCQAKKLGLELFFLGGDGWESPNFFRDVEGELEDKDKIYITSHFSAENVDPQAKRFVENYKKRYGEEPTAPSALGYDAAGVVIGALRRTPQLSREAIKDAINVTSNFQGVTGTITLNEKRNAVKPIVILRPFKRKFIYFATSTGF